MFKTNIKQFSLINWMVFNGHTPKNLSKTDLIQIMTFITYYNEGDFTAILPKKLVKKLINGLIPTNEIKIGQSNGCYTASYYYGTDGLHDLKDFYTLFVDTDFLQQPKKLLKFKKLALNHIINLPEYN